MVPTPGGYARAIVWSMTQNPESTVEPTTVTGHPGYGRRFGEHSRLSQVVAWVVIVAGVVFVVAVIFFSGVFLGWASGDRYGWHHGYGGGRAGTCPMMGPGGMMAPGGMMGPGMMGPGGMGPGGPMGPQQTPTPTPTAPRP